MNRSFDIDLDYGSYTILRTRPDCIHEIEHQFAPHAMENLVDIVEGVQVLNAWHSHNVRNYTVEMLTKKSFSITDPIDGETLKVGATYIFDDFQTIFFFFGKVSRIGIVASDLAAGFPLSTIILFHAKIIIHLTESFWGIGERHFKSLADRGDGRIHERSADCDVCLVTGDPNFAHHAWNELSSLQEIADRGLDRTTSLMVVHEPIGPVNDILGSQFNVARKLARAHTPDLNRLDAFIFCSAGTRINRRLVERISTFADEHLSPSADEVKRKVQAHQGRALWVSVRTRNRTISSQKHVLARLITDYLRHGDDRMVIIDGHSLPFDHDGDAHYVQEMNNGIVHDDMVEADHIVAAVESSLPGAQIVQFVGRQIHESIAVGRHAGFYFCHHGTVQHKLGWFSSIPGLVHCNRDILESMPSHWVQQQSEVAALPVYLPIDLIAEAGQGVSIDELHAHLRHNDYLVIDIDRVSQIITQFADDVEAA